MVLSIDSKKLANIQVRKPQIAFDINPADQFTFQQLTDIYNQTRVDYLVPMPMNVAKLREYVHNYDVNLKQSVVAVSQGTPLGLAMLGVRGDKTWVTRLGVTPHGRQKGIGRRLVNVLIRNSQRLGAKTVVLEVIKNNKPADALFRSLGFQPLRQLSVIRRPPTPMNMAVTNDLYVEELGYEDALALLKTRTDGASWITASESLYNAGNVSALVADVPKIGRGWLVYQNTVFQLSRLVIETEPNASLDVATTLLQHLHWRHPVQDTIVENVADDHKHWPVFRALGYIPSFSRIEMSLNLAAAQIPF